MGGGGVRVNADREVKFLWGGQVGGGGSGGQGGCERRIEVFVKVQKKNGGGSGRGGGVVLGGQVGCERRIEVFVKLQKKKMGGRGLVGGGGSGWGSG